MRFEIKDIKPLGAVRMTQRGKYIKDNAKRYLNYKSVIYSEVLKQLDYEYKPFDCAVNVMLQFKMPIPSSWPKKAKEEAVGKLCTTKPDIDNLTKGLFDALNGILWVDDNRIAVMNVYKVYSDNPGINLEIEPVGVLSYGQAKKKAQDGKRGKAAKTPRTRRNIRARI